MSYTWLYIKRIFTQYRKRQIYLIVGIVFFMVLFTFLLVYKQSNYYSLEQNRLLRQTGDFQTKFVNTGARQLAFLQEHPLLLYTNEIARLEAKNNYLGAVSLISAKMPEEFHIYYKSGMEPKNGEIAVPDKLLIDGKKPKIGDTLTVLVWTGKEYKPITVTIAGIFYQRKFVTNEYLLLSDEDFEAFLKQHSLTSDKLNYDIYVKAANTEDKYKVIREFREQFGNGIFSISFDGQSEEELLTFSFENVISTMLFAAVSAGFSLMAVIFMVLRGEMRILGIFRTIGAKTHQIVLMLTTRILVSGGIGILIGSVLGLLFTKLYIRVTYSLYAFEFYMNRFTFLIIVLGGIVLILLSALPVILMLSLKTPVELMEGENSRYHALSSFIHHKIGKIKHPSWWYSGLELKRLPGRYLLVCIALGGTMIFFSGTFMMLTFHINCAQEALTQEVFWEICMVSLVYLGIAAVTVWCYDTFYYLSKQEEFRQMTVLGISQKLLRRISKLQALRMAVVKALFSTAGGYLLARLEQLGYSGMYVDVKRGVSLPLILTSFVIVMSVSFVIASITAEKVIRKSNQVSETMNKVGKIAEGSSI